MDEYSYLSNGDVNSIEELYNKYKADKTTVDFGWRKFFEGFELASKSFSSDIPDNFQKEFKVINLINGYRSRGHLFTKTNPVRERRKYSPTLDIENFGLQSTDLDTVFQAGQEVGIGPTTLRNIIDHLKQVYCQSIGVEYMYIRNPEQINWIKEQIHKNDNHPNFSKEEKIRIFEKLNQAVGFENFLHTKFVGQKRFSLEGAESLIPALETAVSKGAELGAVDFIFGMAHRGRLNVLTNVFEKEHKHVFNEFYGKDFKDKGFEGDVKYHLGFSKDRKLPNGKKIHLRMCANPSHLEAVAPVAEGLSRAKIDEIHKGDYSKLIPIIIHGDASIAGQGVVYEVIQMAQLQGYKTGGTIHIVVNNQVGFTTNYLDARSSTYCTDVGKTTLSPVFHVNGDDVEAVVHTINIAVEWRQRWKSDVFIDLLCYRKYGHNEGDEPRFTQPLLYKTIAKHPNPKVIYAKQLLEKGVLNAAEAEKIETIFKEKLELGFEASQKMKNGIIADKSQSQWKGIRKSVVEDWKEISKTQYPKKDLLALATKLNTIPKGKNFFKKIEKIFSDRQLSVTENKMDWGMCELLAYATLLQEGHPIRFSGQDVERGTFSHRHAVICEEETGEEYVPLNHLSEGQANFYIYNSLLSEYGVLGFDYGYSLFSPNTLSIWEAQFGDFSNGAQIIIDQFISCAEEKWKRNSGMVMLLPHGYEGQGAEHSSGRMERYLQMCAEGNMQILNCTTPANFYHAMRRQLKREFRKPLIVFTPKKLLRYPKCVSTMDDLANGHFQEVIDDVIPVKSVETLVFCSGKIYYDLLEKREETNAEGLAFVRLEQLYPLPFFQLQKIMDKYKQVKKIIWAQEEPKNMGAWTHILRYFNTTDIEFVGRPTSGVTATGSSERHKQRQEEILNKIFSFSTQKV